MRHAEREDLANNKFAVLESDPSITEKGKLDVMRTADYLANMISKDIPLIIFTSPFKRCIQTAETLKQQLLENSISADLQVEIGLSEILTKSIHFNENPTEKEISFPKSSFFTEVNFPEENESESFI